MTNLFNQLFAPLLPAKKRERDGQTSGPRSVMPKSVKPSPKDSPIAVLDREGSMDSCQDLFASKRLRRSGGILTQTDHNGFEQDEGSPRVFSATSSQSSFGAYMGCESTGDASGSTPCSEQYDEDRAGPRTPCASSDEDLVAAFLSTSQVYPVLCALVRRQQLAVTSPRRHANGDCRQTLAELLALVRRGEYSPSEVTPELLMTMLWIMDSWHSQYKSRADVCLQIYLALHPVPQPMFHYFKAHMLAMQPGILQSCGWNARVESELPACNDLLAQHPVHAAILNFVQDEVVRRCSGMCVAQNHNQIQQARFVAALPMAFDKVVSVF